MYFRLFCKEIFLNDNILEKVAMLIMFQAISGYKDGMYRATHLAIITESQYLVIEFLPISGGHRKLLIHELWTGVLI